MKRVLLFACIMFAASVAANAQTTDQTPPPATTPTAEPVMTFDVTTINYGTIEKGADPVREFKFTNTGTEPLVITGAAGSCGCTVPTYSHEPIKPGESSVISVHYDTKRVGPFTKQVTLTTNETQNTHKLTITGEVKESAPAGAVGMTH